MRKDKNNITCNIRNITLNSKILTAHFTGKERIITLCFIILMLSFINIILNKTNISALSYQSEVGIGFTFNPTLSVSLSSSDLIIPNLTPGSSSDSNSININVATNNAYGYSLYASIGNEEYNSTNLAHTDEDNFFGSIDTNANLASLATNNTWGYRYSLNNGSTWSNYNGLPLYSSDTLKRLAINTEPSEDTVNFKIAAKAGPAQASGTYSNVINFSAVAIVSPITLAEAYASEGKELYHGYYKMQDMTSAICEKTEDINTQLQVIDIRDDKVYWISKLADDHCWMTQNLAYNITTDKNDSIIPLTSEDTDLNEFGNHNYTTQYGYSKDGNNIISWTPDNKTIIFDSSSSLDIEGWNDSNNSPYSASDTNMISGHNSTGNWYNWSSAIASNNSSAFSSSGYENISINPRNSICPKNWRLPTISNQSAQLENSTNEWSRLNLLYNNGSLSSNTPWFKSPLYYPARFSGAPGRIEGGMLSYFKTNYEYYWSSTLSKLGSNIVYHLMLVVDRIAPDYTYYGNGKRSFGFSVRCLAR